MDRFKSIGHCLLAPAALVGVLSTPLTFADTTQTDLPAEVTSHYKGLQGDFYDLLQDSANSDVSAQAFKLHKDAFKLAENFENEASVILQVMSEDELSELAQFLNTPAGKKYSEINKHILGLALKTGAKTPKVGAKNIDEQTTSLDIERIKQARKESASFYIRGGTNFYYLNAPEKTSAMSTGRMKIEFPAGRLSTNGDRVKVIVYSPVRERSTGKLKMTQEITTYIAAPEIHWE